MRRWQLKLVRTVVLIVALGLVEAGVARAVTTAEWEPRATHWQTQTCNAALLKSLPVEPFNLRTGLCFSLDAVEEYKPAIAGLQAGQASLKEALATLQSEVASLKADAPPPPLDFAFFPNSEGISHTIVTSPTADVGSYKTLSYSYEVYGERAFVAVQFSDDGVNWIEPELFEAENVSGTRTIAVSGRYCRVRVYAGTSNLSLLRLIGQFSN